MPVGQLQVLLSKDEYYGWVQYFSFKAPDVAEIQMATLISTVINALSKTKTNTEDFIISKPFKDKKGKYESMGYLPTDTSDMGDFLKPL